MTRRNATIYAAVAMALGMLVLAAIWTSSASASYDPAIDTMVAPEAYWNEGHPAECYGAAIDVRVEHIEDPNIGAYRGPGACQVTLDDETARLSSHYVLCIVLTHELGHILNHVHTSDGTVMDGANPYGASVPPCERLREYDRPPTPPLVNCNGAWQEEACVDASPAWDPPLKSEARERIHRRCDRRARARHHRHRRARCVRPRRHARGHRVRP